MKKQELIKLLRDAYLTGVKEKTFADQMKWLDYDYEAMGGAYAGVVVNNVVSDDVKNMLLAYTEFLGSEASKARDMEDSYYLDKFLGK